MNDGRFKKGHSVSLKTRRAVAEANRERRGDKNGRWLSEGLSYIGIHAWLKREFGKASVCENPDCIYPRPGFDGRMILKPGGFAWAKIEDKEYERKRENFKQLCYSCHYKYDKTGEKGWLTRNNNL